MPEDPTDWVEMRHPDVHTSDDIEPATVTRDAFDALWKGKGWVIVGEEPVLTAPGPSRRPAAAAPSTTTPEV